jgi:hypothetical protein
MFKGNLANTVGELGEYGPFSDKAIKATRTFGIFPKEVSGTLIGKHVDSFTLKTSSKAYKFPAADRKLADWCVANGHNVADYKVMTIAIEF